MILSLYRRKIEVLLNFFIFYREDFNDRSIMELFVFRFDGATAIALVTALLGIWTTNTFFAFPFGTDKIPYNACRNRKQYQNNNNIFHNNDPNLKF